MGLIGGGLLFVIGLFAAILVPVAAKLITDDVKEWLPWIRDRLIDRAVRRLPEDQRERYAEEWRSHVNEVPGDLSKIVVALGLRFAASAITKVAHAGPELSRSMRVQEALRRAIDIGMSLTLLVLAGPLLIVLIVLVRLTSSGPAFFWHERMGLNRRPIRLLKLRTMYTDPADEAAEFEFRVDRRVTRIGRFLRATSLDELPRLINVLRGDLTLVGPRPWSGSVFPREGLDEHLRKRTKVKPGLVAPVQPDAVGDGGITFSERLAKTMADDEAYLANRSLWRDLRTLATVVWRVLRDKRAF